MDDVTTKLQACLETKLPFALSAGRIDMDEDLLDLGLDSLTAVELLLELEGAFDITFPDDMISGETFRTGRTLRRAILDLQGAAEADA